MRADRDHYVVPREGTDDWLAVLYSQGDRAYRALPASRTVSDDADVEQVISAFVDKGELDKRTNYYTSRDEASASPKLVEIGRPSTSISEE